MSWCGRLYIILIESRMIMMMRFGGCDHWTRVSVCVIFRASKNIYAWCAFGREMYWQAASWVDVGGDHPPSIPPTMPTLDVLEMTKRLEFKRVREREKKYQKL